MKSLTQQQSGMGHSQSITVEAIQKWLVSQLSQQLDVTPDEIGLQDPFDDYGLSSREAVTLSGDLQEWLGRELSATLLWEYPNIESLARYLAGIKEESSVAHLADASASAEPIAIIGLGCRLPGAKDPQAFWQLLRNGVDAISQLSAKRWDMWQKKALLTSGHPPYGGFLEQVDQFDPHFFRISSREAKHVDPQQRLLLEVSWEALEEAGVAPDELAGSQTGVFIGISNNDYRGLQDAPSPYTGTGNAFSIAANRLSYLLDLRGPSWVVDTACSSSLVAVHQAVMSLRQAECELALAGGVNLILCPDLTIAFSQAGMMAADGRCKTFDASADGYVRGEGCGIVVLKRLSDAEKDGDRILALIRGSAVNQDGRSNGLTAPNALAQQAVIRQALENADVAPAQISYIEAHGTGTCLGDPIEVNSLKEVLMQGRREHCFLGSAKTNIGHLEAAAGIAGLIKVVLSLQHEEIPPHLHLKELNPHISIEGTPLSIATENQPWPRGGRFAGVSSFGFGGTNAHVILEEAPRPAERGRGGEWESGRVGDAHLLTLSAKSEKSLLELAHRYSKFLASHDEVSLADVCFTANTGRSHFKHRLAVVAESTSELGEHLSAFVAEEEGARVIKGQVQHGQPKIAFLFTGQGSQYVGMGQELYDTQPIFRQTLDRCDEILRPYLSRPLLSVLYLESDQSQDMLCERQLLNQTAYTQPALFALEYALTELWKSWGIEADYVCGHSVGQYVAACVAGVFSLEDGLKLIAERGRLMQALPQDGMMVSLLASEAQVREALQGSALVSIAAINGPQSVVISGEQSAVRRVQREFEQQGIKSKSLNVSHAFHSPLMRPMLADFRRTVREIELKTPTLSFISNLTGEQEREAVTTAEYWVNHVIKSVRFADGMQALYRKGVDIFVEIGPKPTLLAMGRHCLRATLAWRDNYGVWLPTLRHGQADWTQLLYTLGDLYVRGVEIDWMGFNQDYRHRKVLLPTYPFQRKRYWIDSQASKLDRHPVGKEPSETTPIVQLLQQGKVDQLVEQLAETGQLEAKEIKTLPKLLDLLYQQHQRELIEATIENWLYQVSWQRKPRTRTEAIRKGSWLILADQEGVGAHVASYLQARGQNCLVVYPQNLAVGEFLTEQVATRYLNPANPDEFERLLQEVQGQQRRAAFESPVTGVIHLWSLDATPSDQLSHAELSRDQKLLCGSLLHLVQALAKLRDRSLISPSIRLWVVTRGAQSVGMNAPVAVAQAPVWGLGKVVALEHPDLWGGLIDLASQPETDEVATLLAEITAPDGEAQLAFRDGKRLVARLVRAKLQERGTSSPMPPWRSDGCYLITGGLGTLGRHVARWMVEQGVQHLALMGRRGISSSVAEQSVSQLEEAGAKVLIVKADVSNEQECMEGLNKIKSAMPPLRGVVHAAGVLDDGILLRLSYERFKKVMRAKVEGTWHLHTLTGENQLDFFVCFSSVASLVGSAGQGNYAAANAFVDALAHYRHSVGLPALSINWGPWAESGMAVRTDFNAQGVSAMTPEQGLQAFKRLLPSRPSVGVINVDWSQYSVGRVRPFLDQLVKVQVARQEHDLWQQLEKAPQNGRHEILITHIQKNVAQVLGLTHQPPVSQGFAEMGMDSLMALELKNRLESSLGRSLPSTLAFDYPNVSRVAQYLSQEVLALETDPPSRKEPQKRGFDMSENLYTTSLDGVPGIEQLSANQLMAQIAAEFDEAYR